MLQNNAEDCLTDDLFSVAHLHQTVLNRQVQERALCRAWHPEKTNFAHTKILEVINSWDVVS